MVFYTPSGPMLDDRAVTFAIVLMDWSREMHSRPSSLVDWKKTNPRDAEQRRSVMTESTERSWTETITATGGELLDEIKRLVQEGNVRRIVIKQGADTVVEFPLTVGVAGALIAPWLAAAGAIAALITDCSIEVERSGDAPAETTDLEAI